ncbi:hypothetical protein N9218_01505 [bacterium]|nr:hypothetical protein [bacterium]
MGSSISSGFYVFFSVHITGEIPLIILNSATLFPDSILPLHIFESRYRRMLSEALESRRIFAVAMRWPGIRRDVSMTMACLGVVRV